MKVSETEVKNIQETFRKYRKQGFPKEVSYRLTAKEVGRGRTTVVDHTLNMDVPEEPKPKYNVGYKGEPKNYIITGWEIRVGIDDRFVDTLQQMAKFYDAELLLVPCQKSDVAYLPQKIKDIFTIVTDNVTFNSNLQLKYVETNALIQSPLSGHVGAYPDKTTIIPGLTKELRSEPSQYYVKQLISTGSLGPLNANASDYEELEEDKDLLRKWRSISTRRHGKATAIAQNYIVPSALIVNVLDNKTFLTRFVTSAKGGVVYDLDKKFMPDDIDTSQPAALYCGDVHAYSIHQPALNATKEMIVSLEPKEVIVGDFFDGVSINHHEMQDQVKMYNAPSLREEADITIDLLREFSELSNKVVYLQSNHDDFVLHFLKMGDRAWRINKNYEIACGLQFFRAQTGEHPIISLLGLKKFGNVKFVKDTDNHYVGKVLCKHGHEGASGVRLGFMGLAKIYNQYLQGHVHSPAVFRNAVCVGLLAELEQGYNKGASGWLHSNAIIHPDNTIQLLPIINGRWRV